MNKIKLTESYYMLNRSEQTSDGFKDISELYFNDKFIGSRELRFECTPDEPFKFYRSMLCCLYDLRKKRKEEIKKIYKEVEGIKRVSKEDKLFIEDLCDADTLIKDYYKLSDIIMLEMGGKTDCQKIF